MRQSLMQSFDDIYVLDLHGNTKKKERALDDTKDENVFDIQQGVAIGIFVKRKGKVEIPHSSNVYHTHLWEPLSPLYLFRPQDTILRAEYEEC
jgi:predicted helicase